MFKQKTNKVNKRAIITFLIIVNTVLLFYAIEGRAGNYHKCISKAVTTADTLNCINTEDELIDKQLNASYTKLLNLLSLSGQKKLRASERTWLKFRENECIFSGHSMEGGTGEPVLISSCYLEMTKERLLKLIQELDYYKENPTR